MFTFMTHKPNTPELTRADFRRFRGMALGSTLRPASKRTGFTVFARPEGRDWEFIAFCVGMATIIIALACWAVLR
jgi:hypothetical protein